MALNYCTATDSTVPVQYQIDVTEADTTFVSDISGPYAEYWEGGFVSIPPGAAYAREPSDPVWKFLVDVNSLYNQGQKMCIKMLVDQVPCWKRATGCTRASPH